MSATPTREAAGPGTITSAHTSPILCVVVAHRPGPWFEESLIALAQQDYPALRHLILDTADDPTLPARVHGILPDAQVLVLKASRYSQAVNALITSVALTPFVMLCHDDVALAPSAVRELFEEAVRSNAGVVGPKVVDWDQPEVLLEVGMSVDKTGAVSQVAQPGEVDQAQHDAVRDVFALSSAALLVRSDLLKALGGFDTVMTGQGEDVDFCWRARIAGARVMIAPGAVARHRETLTRRGLVHDGAQRRRNQVRMLLSNYGVANSIRVIPQAIIAAIGATIHALFSGNLRRARAIVGAWVHGLGHLPSVAGKRARISSTRRLSDAEVRRFHDPGFIALNRFVQQRAVRLEGDANVRAREALAYSQTALGQVQLLVWAVTIFLVVFGSRDLISNGIPVVDEFARFPEDATGLIGESFSSLRGTGLGTEGLPAIGQLLIGLLGLVFFGQMGLLQTTLLLATFLIAAVGAVRLFSPFDSVAARMFGPWIFATAPVPYNALVHGSWSSLAVYAGLPWLLRWLVSLAGVAPYSIDETRGGRLRALAGASITLALMAVVSPFVVVLVPVVALGWVVGGLLMGRRDALLRYGVFVFAAMSGAAILHFPRVAQVLTDDIWTSIAGSSRGSESSLSVLELLTMATGPHGRGLFGWALILLAALGLLLPNGDRLVWAVRGWTIALLCLSLAWLGESRLTTVSLPRVEVLLAPAAFGLCIAAVMATVAVERDLRDYRFGWRQLLPALVLVGLVGTLAATFGGALHGRWETPRNGYESSLRFLEGDDPSLTRMLWLGDDRVLPVGGAPLDGYTVAVTEARIPTLRELWPVPDADGGAQVAATLDLATNGGTNRLGRLLAPYGIRWVVVVEDSAPAPFGQEPTQVPARLSVALSEQLDLIRVDVRQGLTVYRNDSWLSVAAVVQDPVVSEIASPRSSAVAAARISGVGGTNFTGIERSQLQGPVQSDAEVYLAMPLSERWTLEGVEQSGQRPAFGWATAFPISSNGEAVLQHSTPTSHRVALLLQLGLWLVAALWTVFGSRRSR